MIGRHPSSSLGLQQTRITQPSNQQTMATLSVASRGAQGITLPALLVAVYANEQNPNAQVDLLYVDSDKLSGSSAIITLKVSGTEITTAEQIVFHFAEKVKTDEKSKPLVSFYPIC